MNVVPDLVKLAALREGFEGYKTEAYQDTGNVWTIGTGHTYNYDKKRKVQKGDIISRDTNTRWTIYAMKDAIDNANIYIHVQLNPFEAAAIVDYIFNRGIGNFLSTQLDELINANPKDPRIKAEIIGTGLKDRLGHIWWGLGRRRRAEAYLYVTGNIKLEWPRWSTPTF